MPEEIPRSEEAHRFADADIDRRTSVRLSTATGAALTLPGNASALVSGAAFEEAGGIAAGTQDAGISAGSLVGPTDGEVTTRELVESDTGAVHFVGGVFPPASQENLHPFGLLDHSASFLGYLMLTNALGYVQTRSIEGEVTATFGGSAIFEVEGAIGDAPNLTASGSRRDDGSVFTGGQSNQVVVTVEELSATAAVSDGVPDGWTVDGEYGDVESFDEKTDVVRFGSVGAVDPAEETPSNWSTSRRPTRASARPAGTPPDRRRPRRPSTART